jgi:hypothetical protein
MPQVRLEKGAADRYKQGMESRVAVLERIAEQTDATLRDIRSEMREFRTEMRDLRQEMHTGFDTFRQEIQSGFSETRRVHVRDFRITFAALIATALGLAGLVAHSAHWL